MVARIVHRYGSESERKVSMSAAVASIEDIYNVHNLRSIKFIALPLVWASKLS